MIYMKKFLHSDWLREMQFSVNTMQNRGNSVQKASYLDNFLSYRYHSLCTVYRVASY